MQNYTAKKDKKKFYSMIRPTYKRWTLGHMGVSACVGAEIAFLRLSQILTSNKELSLNLLVFCFGLCLFPVFFSIIFRGIAISGGREILNRLTDKVTLDEKFMLMEYVPKNARNDCICYRMNYADIQRLVYRKGRLKIEGSFLIIYYRHVNFGVMDYRKIEQVKDGSFYLYAYYESFRECMGQISQRSGKTILKRKW